MGSVGWQSDTSLEEVMIENFTSFNYYQLVKLLHLHARNHKNYDADSIRYSADLAASFPRHEITDVDITADYITSKETITLKSPNFCVASVFGPLSEPYLEWMRDRARDGDFVMANFIDIFNNRLHKLRYEIKSARFPGLHIGKPEDSNQARFLNAAIGLLNNTVIDKFKNVDALKRRKLLAIAGLLVNQRRSAPVLERILSELLGVSIRITQMIGAWCKKAEEDISKLGKCNCSLGENASLGSHVWDQQARILLNIGPVDFDLYNRLLPGESLYMDLVNVLRYITNRAADYEVILEAEKKSIPTKVNHSNIGYPALHTKNNSWTVKLGQTSWLSESPSGKMPRQTRYVIFAFEEAA